MPGLTNKESETEQVQHNSTKPLGNHNRTF